MDPHLISSIVTLLLIACMVASFAQWIKQPYTIALVLVGLAISFTRLTPHIHLDHDLTFTVMLPPLLFYGALHLDIEQLFKNWRPIFLLSTVGVLCSTFFIGFALNALWGIDFIYALLFGALITPTDPISVLAILKKVGAPHRLRLILEGESLFNDGTAVVVFSIILGIIVGGDQFHLGGAVVKFLTVAGGGAVIGFLCGWIVYWLLKQIDDHLLEVSLTVVLAFGAPLLAEALHCSGIIAVIIAGLIIGNYGRIYSMSEKTRETIETFWEVINFIINSILFLVIGIELQVIAKGNFSTFAHPILTGIIIFILARIIVVYPIIALKNTIFSHKIPWKWTHVIFWGGLRGSIPIALVLGLYEDFPHRDLFLTVSFSIVLFSLVVQGLTIQPLVKKLNLEGT